MAADPTLTRTQLLARLEDEERTVSASRRRVQDRIDYFAGSGDVQSAEALRERERELSARRRELHQQIDELKRQRD